MEIHQVSVNYLHEQDRILVRINSRESEEIRLWLTRRLCLGWVPMLRSAVGKLPRPSVDTPQENDSPGTSTNSAQSTQANAPAWAKELNKLQDLKQSDFKTPFVNEVKAWPIGAEPLLVTTIRMTPQGKDRLDMVFEETLMVRKSQARGFQASLETTLLNGFMHLLEQALVSSDWHIGSESSTEPPPSQTHTDSDDFTLVRRPKYLH